MMRGLPCLKVKGTEAMGLGVGVGGTSFQNIVEATLALASTT